MLFGLSLGLRLHHHERLITFVWALVIFMLYYLGMVGMNAAGQSASQWNQGRSSPAATKVKS